MHESTRFLKYFLIVFSAISALKSASEELDAVEQQATKTQKSHDYSTTWAFLKSLLLKDKDMQTFSASVDEQLQALDRVAAQPDGSKKLSRLLELLNTRSDILHACLTVIRSNNYGVLYESDLYLRRLSESNNQLETEAATILTTLDTWSEHHCELSFAHINAILNKVSLAFNLLTDTFLTITDRHKISTDISYALTSADTELPKSFTKTQDELLSMFQTERILLDRQNPKRLREVLQLIIKQDDIFIEQLTQKKFGLKRLAHNLRQLKDKYFPEIPEDKYNEALKQSFDPTFKQCLAGINQVKNLCVIAKNDANTLASQIFKLKKFIFFSNELKQRTSYLCRKETELTLSIPLLPHLYPLFSPHHQNEVKAYLRNYIEFYYILLRIYLITNEQPKKTSEESWKPFFIGQCSVIFNRFTHLKNECSQFQDVIKLIFASHGQSNQRFYDDSIFRKNYLLESVYEHMCNHTIFDYFSTGVLFDHILLAELLSKFANEIPLKFETKPHVQGAWKTLLDNFSHNKKNSLTFADKIVEKSRQFVRGKKARCVTKKQATSRRSTQRKAKRKKKKQVKKPARNLQSPEKHQKPSQQQKASDVSMEQENYSENQPSKAAQIETLQPKQKAPDFKPYRHTQKKLWHELFGSFTPTIRIIDKSDDKIIARCWRSFDSSDNVLILMKRSSFGEAVTHDNCTMCIDSDNLPKMQDDLEKGWDIFHTIPAKLLEKHLVDVGTKHNSNNTFTAHLGYEMTPNTHAVTIEAKLFRGYMANPHIDEFDALWNKHFGQKGAFIWGMRNQDHKVFHRCFHACA